MQTKKTTTSNDPWQCGAVSAGTGEALSVDAVLRTVTNHARLKDVQRASPLATDRRTTPLSKDTARASTSHNTGNTLKTKVRVFCCIVLFFKSHQTFVV